MLLANRVVFFTCERNSRRKEGKKEIEVMSALSQLGITVKARFVGALRKGICNFPPLVCTAVYNSYPSPQSLCFLLLPPFITLNFFQFKLRYVVYLKPVVETTQITVFFSDLLVR